MFTEWRALRQGESTSQRRREIEHAYERFLSGDAEVERTPARPRRGVLTPMREIILHSWQRSLDHLVDPEAQPSSPDLTADELAALREVHPLATALPMLERLLFREAEDSGFIVAVGDAQGRLLWIDGDRRLRALAEDMGFAEGTDWSERAVGTSAPGSALALDHPLQLFGAEHFSRAVHQWSCAATPVHDPETGAILGVIDITGRETVAEPHVLPFVEATRAAVEAELSLEAMRRRVGAESLKTARRRKPERAARRSPQLMVLGREPALLTAGAETLELGRRHAEILVALAGAPQGLTSGALTDAVYGEAGSTETLRAELARLRKLLSAHRVPIEVRAKPYRLSQTISVDAHDTLAALGRGAHRLALSGYGGEALPGSEAPCVEALRHDLEMTLRQSMLQSASPELLFEYAQQWAEDDAEVWQTLLQILPPLSPKRARVVAKLDAL
ncbi:MAG: hypothetical protein ACTJGT_11825 [Microbacteriaceae bacterium]